MHNVGGCNITAGGGASIDNIPQGYRDRIAAFVNRTNTEVTVVGNRAKGTARIDSDWDYLIGGNSKIRHSAEYYLPHGSAGGAMNASGNETGIDVLNIFTKHLDITRPFIKFSPY